MIIKKVKKKWLVTPSTWCCFCFDSFTNFLLFNKIVHFNSCKKGGRYFGIMNISLNLSSLFIYREVIDINDTCTM